MARGKTVRVPTAASLPNNLRIPSTTPILTKTLGRLSRQVLIDLVLEWLDDRNVQSFRPYLAQDEAEDRDDNDEASPYAAAKDIEEVRETYRELQDRKGGKREVVEQILDGDWRHGITLRQLAMVDLRYMEDHPASLRWTALELSRIVAEDGQDSSATRAADISACVPRIHAAMFLSNLQREVSSLVKAHYHLVRSKTLPLTFLRILVTDSPYQNSRSNPGTLVDSSRVLYVAFPDSCPYIYTSISSSTGPKANPRFATDTRTLQQIVRDAIPKALSQQQQRLTLKATSLTAKSLQALLALRGPGRSNAANGAFSIFADAALEGSPLDPRPSHTVTPEDFLQQQQQQQQETQKSNNQSSTENTVTTTRTNDFDDSSDSPAKKRRLAVHTRFGTAGMALSPLNAPLDRLDIRLLDPHHDTPATTPSSSHPTLSLTFSGADVIGGFRKLADLGILQPDRIPAWMTGEEAVSVAVVKGGRRVPKDG
ncbi:hypothetical protein ASPZODRAFT_134928 [Penicilliopsis zonata CBS 506.65]|uniref:CHL4 family chromosome segregation protein n=1 Tax=Penicilliopsis zonata CBS 506.65 TaxID=1073090 RepID=A0A1L9SCD2_9EURO|nr:hypothetical protein ASPZODRAFT_134928 [Penicilliopsis zonata CBS 506.65]OJJ44792.1 hypothetical protein ASPZODRAFT_134928 [Penicilliopsis zonata CBS 506.65]